MPRQDHRDAFVYCNIAPESPRPEIFLGVKSGSYTMRRSQNYASAFGRVEEKGAVPAGVTCRRRTPLSAGVRRHHTL